MKAFKDLGDGEGIYLESDKEWRSVFKIREDAYYIHGANLGELPEEDIFWPELVRYEAAFDYWKKWVANREYRTVRMFFSNNGVEEIVKAWRKNYIVEPDKNFMKDLGEIDNED